MTKRSFSLLPEHPGDKTEPPGPGGIPPAGQRRPRLCPPPRSPPAAAERAATNQRSRNRFSGLSLAEPGRGARPAGQDGAGRRGFGGATRPRPPPPPPPFPCPRSPGAPVSGEIKAISRTYSRATAGTPPLTPPNPPTPNSCRCPSPATRRNF